MGFAEKVPAEGVKGIPGLLHEVASQAPHEGEDEDRADEGVELGSVHSHVNLGLLATEEGVHEGAEDYHSVDLHLVLEERRI